MTLEAAIAKVTTALEKLTETIVCAARSGHAATPEQTTSSMPSTTTGHTTESALTPVEPKVRPSAGTATSDSYNATASALTALAREQGRDAAVAVLATFGAKKLPDVEADQLPAVLAAVQQARGIAE